MNKRKFLRNSAKLAAAISLPLNASTPAMAQVGQYNVITPPLSTANPDKIEVLEYFWFGCPHCHALEPTIKAWAANRPEYVDFVRQAPPLNKRWTAHSEAFYAAEILGITDTMFEPFFEAIHVEKKSLRDRESISKWVAQLDLDVNEDKMLETMKSFAVNAKIGQAMQNAVASRVSAVPSIVVNGKYLSTVSMAGGQAQLISLMNELIEQERSEA